MFFPIKIYLKNSYSEYLIRQVKVETDSFLNTFTLSHHSATLFTWKNLQCFANSLYLLQCYCSLKLNETIIRSHLIDSVPFLMDVDFYHIHTGGGGGNPEGKGLAVFSALSK